MLNDEEKLDKEESEKKEDNRSFSEKAEDTMDDIVGDVQDFFYGENSPENPISTIEKPNGIREVNKVQTRRNINHKLLNTKIGKIFSGILLGVFGVVMIVIIIRNFIL